MDVTLDLCVPPASEALLQDAPHGPGCGSYDGTPAATAARGDIDRRLGGCLRALRQARGLSQQSVAEAVGLSAQQLQKYERGINRVSVATLLALARVLQVSPANLIASLEREEEVPEGALRDRALLFEYFSRLGSDQLRRKVLDLLAHMGQAPHA